MDVPADSEEGREDFKIKFSTIGATDSIEKEIYIITIDDRCFQSWADPTITAKIYDSDD